MRIFLVFCFFFIAFNSGAPFSCPVQAASPKVQDASLPALEPGVADIIFSGTERLHYAVSWSGGVKIGDVWLEITRDPKVADTFSITAIVRSSGALSLFYPIDDSFRCLIYGPMWLPERYEVHQQEGSRDIRRLTTFDQKNKLVRYRKNQEPWRKFSMGGKVYNEISAFIITRALKHRVGVTHIVPTFAERQYHQVQVACTKKEYKKTILGRKNTLKVLPRLPFKGVYSKEGETVLYITDDLCRVPVELHAKIPVGSLVAELVEYKNPACKPKSPNK